MELFFLKGYKDCAATNLADFQAMCAALANPQDATNAATLGRIAETIPALVQSDSGEPLIFHFYDSASTASSWVTDSATTLACGLGTPDPANASVFGSTLSFTITGSTRTGTLALNTSNLQQALTTAASCNQRPGPWLGFVLPGSGSVLGQFFLHLRKTTSGKSESVALLQVTVEAGVLSSTPANLETTSYVTTIEAREDYVINLAGVTSLTGGGDSTLDGQDAGSDEFPVGCVVLTSDGDVGRHWKLKGTYIAATDLAAGQIKPTNSDAVLNPCYWQLI